MSQNENKKELVVSLVPEYEKIEDKIRACAEIKIYYGETKLSLDEVDYSLYFDEKLVRSFLDVTCITVGYHEFKAVIEYNGITKIVVATKRYSQYEDSNNNDNTNNNKPIIYNKSPKYICKRRFPIDTAKVGSVYYTGAIKITNISSDYIYNIIKNVIWKINNALNMTSDYPIRNIQINKYDVSDNIWYTYNATHKDYIFKYIKYNAKNIRNVIIHLYTPFFMRITNIGKDFEIYKDYNRSINLGYKFREYFIKFPRTITLYDNFNQISAKLTNISSSSTIKRFKVKLGINKFELQVYRSYAVNNYNLRKFKNKQVYSDNNKHNTYIKPFNTGLVIKLRYKTKGNNYTDWKFYKINYVSPAYSFAIAYLIDRHKKNRLRS